MIRSGVTCTEEVAAIHCPFPGESWGICLRELPKFTSSCVLLWEKICPGCRRIDRLLSGRMGALPSTGCELQATDSDTLNLYAFQHENRPPEQGLEWLRHLRDLSPLL